LGSLVIAGDGIDPLPHARVSDRMRLRVLNQPEPVQLDELAHAELVVRRPGRGHAAIAQGAKPRHHLGPPVRRPQALQPPKQGAPFGQELYERRPQLSLIVGAGRYDAAGSAPGFVLRPLDEFRAGRVRSIGRLTAEVGR